MALSSPSRKHKKIAARPADVPVSPGRQRSSTGTKPAAVKGKPNSGKTRQHFPLTVDIPTAPFLGNFLSPLDVAAVEQVSK